MANDTPRSSTDSSASDFGKLILRLAVGALMLLHGIAKVKGGVGPISDMLTAKGLPAAMAYGAYVGEVLAPALIIIGLFTRPAGLIVVFNMIMAVWLAHSADVMKLGSHGGWAIELPALYMLGALALVFLGAGRLSLSRGRGPMD